MKLLIVLLAVLAGVWLWQRGRRLKHSSRQAGDARTGTLPMIRCTRCGIHVPGDEAVTGQRGSYCSIGHRRESEGE